MYAAGSEGPLQVAGRTELRRTPLHPLSPDSMVPTVLDSNTFVAPRSRQPLHQVIRVPLQVNSQLGGLGLVGI
jgi:hypothetical protein